MKDSDNIKGERVSDVNAAGMELVGTSSADDAMNSKTASGTSATKGMVVRLVVAAIFLGASTPLLNTTIYPRMAEYFAIGRELSTLTNAALYFVFAVIALRKPHVLNARRWSGVVIVVLVVGVVLLGLGLDGRSVVLTSLGLLARVAGNVWATTMFAVALLKVLDKRVVLGIVGAGSVVGSLMYLPFSADTNAYISGALIMLAALVPIVLVQTDAERTFDTIADVPPDQANVIEGTGGVRMLVKLCLCMTLMGIGSGFALTFNEQGNSPQVTIVDCALTVLMVVAIVVFEPWDRNQKTGVSLQDKAAKSSREGGESASAEDTGGFGTTAGHDGRRVHIADDTLFTVSVMCLMAGMLVAMVSFGRPTTAANVLIRLARTSFDMMLWLIIYSIGRRNVFSLLPVLGFVRGSGSLATAIGASGGHIVNDTMAGNPFGAQCALAVFAFACFALLWIFFRDFSVGNLILGVQKVDERQARVRGASYLEERCHSIGEEYGLTPRETEILGQLARGRDGKFIQQEYVLSYNTVKTHIKHIYTKLDVHSRQELLDLIEQDGGLA